MSTSKIPEKDSSSHSELFFTIVSVDEAVDIVKKMAKQTRSETISIDIADGRVLAESVTTMEDIPGFAKSWKDGYACVAADTYTASESSPVILSLVGSISMGKTMQQHIQPGECVYVPTGGQIPIGADAVVMIEYTEIIGEKVLIHQPVVLRENIIAKDEDFKQGTTIYQAGHTLRLQDSGVLAAIGKPYVSARKNPQIGVISTGIELVPSEATPSIGEIRDVNSHLIATFLQRQGAIPVKYGIVRDNPEDLMVIIQKASKECDAVIISGGSSKDHSDVTFHAVASLGTIYVHGISIAPGKPTIIGECYDTPVIGLPGHPVSTFMVLSLVVSPLIEGMKGTPSKPVFSKTCKMATDLNLNSRRL